VSSTSLGHSRSVTYSLFESSQKTMGLKTRIDLCMWQVFRSAKRICTRVEEIKSHLPQVRRWMLWPSAKALSQGSL
jgi:hypothetical protein